MSVRQCLPGEHLSEQCGHHCGVRSSADEGKMTFIGHCPCPECLCLLAEYPSTVNIPAIEPELRVPMCEQWYARSGGVKPWE
jgi:hypothetical protein